MQTNALPRKYPDDSCPVGIYILIPFCLTRCDYCGFVSYPFDPILETPYIDAVIREIRSLEKSSLFVSHSFPESLDTIYLGGGTPTMFSPASIERLIEAIRRTFNLAHPVEFTVEVIPGTYTKTEFLKLHEFGVSRISIGAQSLNDHELRSMNRSHTSEDFMRVFNDARVAGFDNISVDLLAGYPGQTLESVINSLNRINELGPDHVSVYLLEIKTGSKIENRINFTQERLLDDDIVADIYEAICEELRSAGFNQYEISNFSKPGMMPRHNLKYWTDQVFLGFGAAAHGMTGRIRYSNVADLGKYIDATFSNNSGIESLIEVDPLTRFKDAMIMGLRLTKGVDLTLMSSRYGFDSYGFVKETLQDLDDAELFTMGKDTVKLTPRGRLLSNIIFSRFV